MRDSKKLTPKRREQWFDLLTRHPKIRWAVARVRPGTIDRINIARAADLAARRVLAKLASPPKKCLGICLEGMRFAPRVLLDGGLALSKSVPHKAIIKGDEKVPAIAAASIIAKVTRDRIMVRLHKKYPQYRFDLHKGYGTKLHRSMIGIFKVCPAHRSSFAKRFEA